MGAEFRSLERQKFNQEIEAVRVRKIRKQQQTSRRKDVGQRFSRVDTQVAALISVSGGSNGRKGFEIWMKVLASTGVASRHTMVGGFHTGQVAGSRGGAHRAVVQSPETCLVQHVECKAKAQRPSTDTERSGSGARSAKPASRDIQRPKVWQQKRLSRFYLACVLELELELAGWLAG